MGRFLATRAPLLALGVVAGVAPLMLLVGTRHVSAAAAQSAPVQAPDPAAFQSQLDRLKRMVPDQSHAMADVGYHFGNLWFAGERKNFDPEATWPQ